MRVGGPVDEVFEFEEEFLGMANAEGRDEDDAAIFHRVVDRGLQARLADTAVNARRIAERTMPR